MRSIPHHSSGRISYLWYDELSTIAFSGSEMDVHHSIGSKQIKFALNWENDAFPIFHRPIFVSFGLLNRLLLHFLGERGLFDWSPCTQSAFCQYFPYRSRTDCCNSNTKIFSVQSNDFMPHICAYLGSPRHGFLTICTDLFLIALDFYFNWCII